MRAFRLFRIGPTGLPSTLFHGWHGKKELPLDTELVAEKKQVKNPGGGKRRVFTSGWHVVLSEEALSAYTTRFKHPEQLVACEVKVGLVRDKPGSKIKLADTMLITNKNWMIARIKIAHGR